MLLPFASLQESSSKYLEILGSIWLLGLLIFKGPCNTNYSMILSPVITEPHNGYGWKRQHSGLKLKCNKTSLLTPSASVSCISEVPVCKKGVHLSLEISETEKSLTWKSSLISYRFWSRPPNQLMISYAVSSVSCQFSMYQLEGRFETVSSNLKL